MTRLALIRHGHTAWNRAGRIQGRSDIPLDADACSELSRKALPLEWTEAALWASPLSRAKETARLIADRTPVVTEALMEMNWGDWEGQHGKILRADASSGFRDIEDWGWDYSPPGGESPRAVADRLTPWLMSLQGDAVAICHIGIMRVLLAQATGWDFAGPCPFTIKRNRMYVLQRTAQGWQHDPEPVRLLERPA